MGMDIVYISRNAMSAAMSRCIRSTSEKYVRLVIARFRLSLGVGANFNLSSLLHYRLQELQASRGKSECLKIAENDCVTTRMSREI